MGENRKRCTAPECAEKQKRAERRKVNFLEKEEKKFDSHNRKIHISNHFLKRISERYISINEINTVLEQGWLVDTFLKDIKIDKPNGETVTEQRPTFIMLGFYKLNKSYQPLHIVVSEYEDDRYLAVTAYNPLPEIWGEFYDEKICYCRSTYNDNYEYM